MTACSLVTFLPVLTSLMTWGVVTSVAGNDVATLVGPVVEAGLGCHHVAGLSMSAVRGGQVVVSRGFGVADLASGRPVTADTLFGIASLTKAFTATLLAKQLEEDRTLGVGSNIYKVLGRDRFNNTLRSVYATLEDLLAHRMGIPRHNFMRLSTSLDRENLVRRMKFLPNKGGFRDSFYYSDLMYGLAARASEVLGNGQWEDLMASYLLRPLAMSATNFSTRLSPCRQGCATPYVWRSGRLVPASPSFIRHWAGIGGSGAMLSSAADMAKWLLFQLGDGRTQTGQRILQASTLRDTHTARNSLSSNSETGRHLTRPGSPVTLSNDGYALGWKTGYYRGLRLVQHSGSTFGYKAMLSLLPDLGIGVFTAMNGLDSQYRFRLPLHAHVLDVLLGETPWVNSSTICTFPGPWHATRTRRERRGAAGGRRTPRGSPRRSLSQYVGRYQNPAYGTLDVKLRRGSLTAEFGIARWRLSSSGGDDFRAYWTGEPPRLNFHFRFLGGSRSVTALKIPDFEARDPPVFYRIPNSQRLVG